jgi:hypothetical protein
MSELSQNPKSSVPAYVFRFALERGRFLDATACLKSASKRLGRGYAILSLARCMPFLAEQVHICAGRVFNGVVI